MNVGLISREYPPFFGGGIGTYTVQWARALANAGHRVVVVTVSENGQRRREESGGITVERLPFLHGTDWSAPHPAIATPEVIAAFRDLHPVSALAMQIERDLPGIVKEFGLEVVEFPDTGALAWFGLNNRRLGGSWRAMPPVVTTVHSPTAWIAAHNRQLLALREDHELISMERDVASWSDALVCPSQAMAQWAADNWPIDRSKIAVIPYPLGELESAPVGAGSSGGGAFKLLFIGRLEPRKGIDTLIEAVGRLGNEKVSLDALGDDTPDPSGNGHFGVNSLRACEGMLRPDAVRLLGRRPPEELPALRESADAIVVPSPMDNFPFVCVEAMAEGRLVIAAAAGGAGELIRDGESGLLFEPGNAPACAAAIAFAAAMSPDRRRAMGMAAAKRVRELCGNGHVVARRLAHYAGVRTAGASSRHPSERMIVINGSGASTEGVDALRHAVEITGEDFAHGWVRTGSGVHAFSTPRLRTLGLSSRVLGPVVIRESALARAGVDDLLTEDGAGSWRVGNTWILVMELCAAGCRGVCVPGVLESGTLRELHPLDRALWQELKTIKSSRGWRVLNRVYDVLHVVRGRGIRRRYDSGSRGGAT